MFMCAHVVRSVSNLNELVQKWDHRKKEKYMKVFSYGSLFLMDQFVQVSYASNYYVGTMTQLEENDNMTVLESFLH